MDGILLEIEKVNSCKPNQGLHGFRSELSGQIRGPTDPPGKYPPDIPARTHMAHTFHCASGIEI